MGTGPQASAGRVSDEVLMAIECLLAHRIEVGHDALLLGKPPIGLIDIDLTAGELLQHLKA